MKTFFAALLTLSIAGSAVADDYIVIVFDNSGSMNDYMRKERSKSRLQVAQDALVSVLSKVPDSTHVGILTFSGWIYDIQKVDHAAAEAAVRKVRANTATPLYEFIRKGATRLLKERQDHQNVGSYKLLVVTDGQASDPALNDISTFSDGTAKPGVLADVLNRGIIVDAIGLDMTEQHALSTQINGVYMRGDNPSSLEKALAQSVAEVGFGQSSDASNEAFREISELPDGFVAAALKGLTSFPNHPIGEKAPIEVVAPDGSVTMQSGDVAPVAANDGGWGLGTAFVIFSGAVFLVLIFIFFAGRS